MALRFKSEFLTIKNQEYAVEIWDSSFSGSVTTFTVDARGFEMSLDGDSGFVFNPFIGTEARFGMIIENSTHEQLITDMAGAAEGRFQVKITKTASANLYWAGNVLPDIAAYEEHPYPYLFEVAATDGVGALKDIDYNNAGVVYTGWQTIIEHVINILGKLNTSAFWGGSDVFLRTIFNWFEDDQPTGGANDPLKNTRINHLAFFDREGEKFVYNDCFDVLTEICQITGCRFMLADGAWRMYQVSEFDSGSKTERRYDKTGTYLSNASVTYTTAFDQATVAKVAGTNYQFFPALNQVIIIYNHRNRRNLLAGIAWDETDTTSHNLGNVDYESGAATLLFTGALQIKVTNVALYSGQIFNLVFNLTLIVGGRNYTRTVSIAPQTGMTHGSPQWDTGATPYRIGLGAYHAPAVAASSNFNASIQFETLPLPVSGDCTVQVALDSIRTWDGGIIPASSLTVEYDLNGAYLEIKHNGILQLAENAIEYKTVNDTANNTSKIEIETTIADGTTPNSIGRLQVYNGATWEDADLWRVGGTGTARPITDRLAREMMAIQRTPIRRMNARVYGFTEAYHKYTDASFGWIIAGGTYFANDEMFEGDFIQIQRLTTGFTTVNPVAIVKLPVNPTSVPIAAPPGIINNSTTPAAAQTQPSAVLAPLAGAFTSGQVTAGILTSIPVTGTLQANAYQAGDSLFLINPSTGAVTSVNVTADVADGDTAIAVSGYLNEDFPEGTMIFYNPQNVTIQSGSGGTASVPLSLGDLLTWFGQLTQSDETLSLDWPLQVTDIVIETDASAGDGLVAGLRFDENGIQLYVSTSTTPVAKLLPDGTWELRTHPNAGNGSTAGIVISKSGGVLVYGATSVTPQAGFGTNGSFLARVDFLIETSENAGNGSTAGIRWDTTNGFKAYKNASGGATPTVSIPVAGTWELRTNGNTGVTASGVILGSDSGIRAFKSTSTTPAFYLKHTGQLVFNYNGHPAVEAGLFYVNNGLIWLDQDGSGSKVHPQYGHLRNFNIIGLLTNWTTGWKDVFWRVTSEYAGLEIYRIGYSVGDSAGSGSGSNVAFVRHQNAAGTVTTTVGTMTCDTTGIANIVTASNLITLAQGDLIYFEVSSVKSTPAKGLIADLYFRKA